MAEDERRMSEDGVVEMDGTGLYERDNWPLADDGERSMSPDTVISAGKDSPNLVEEVRDDAVMRKKEDIGQEPAMLIDDKEISDIEEDEVSSADELEGSLDGDERQSRSERSSIRSGTSQLSQRLRANGDVSISPVVSERRRSLHVPRSESRTDVSPIRNLDSPRSLSSGNEETHQTNGIEEPESEEEPSELRMEIEDHEDTDSLYEDRDEERDVATPMPMGGFDGTSDPSPSISSPSRTQPHVNGRSTPTTNGHGRNSSIIKGTPPQRTSSRRSQQISHNKQRVRYSWQSVQDEEPNRPRIHIIKLVSNTATASAGFPQGEAFGFAMSPCGRRIAAYNSARLYVLQTAAFPLGISQDYALKRRPLAVDIVDDGNILAILADEHTVNIYDLTHQRLQRTNSIKLDFPTNCIALAPTGGLLAVAYEGGVEIFSLDPNALPTDRRAVKSQRMDRLTFSEDGSTLLGTTTRISVSSTVVVSVPVFPASSTGLPTHEELKEAWCTDLLHPENVRNSSHAAFMRENRRTCNERLFAWNGLDDTFGILNVGDMQYGNVDFPVVISPPLSTCGGLGAAIHSCPAIDEHGDTVAMIVNDRTIRLYIVPHQVDDEDTTVEAHSIDHELDEGYGCPFSEARWVYSSASLPAPLDNQTKVQGRLIVASPGAVVESNVNEETIDDIEGGRIILFDFDPQFAGQPGETFSLTLGKSPPQMLEEPELDVAHEVALVRRRTVNQSKGGLSQRPITLGRAATTFGERGGRTPRAASPSSNDSTTRDSMLSIHSLQSDFTRSLPDLVESNEALDTLEEDYEIIDEPYAQNAPRSQASLQRAASNAQRHRFQALEERNQEQVNVESSSNFIPLPEYTEEPNAPLPSRFRAMAGLDVPTGAPAVKPALVTTTNGDHASPSPSTPTTPQANTTKGYSAEQNGAAATFPVAPTRQMSQRSRDAMTPPSSATGSAPRGGFNPLPRSGTFDSIPPVSRQGTFDSIPPVSRSDTFDSVRPMPRSLQRAYANAASPLGNGPPPNLIGDWENVSPIVGPRPQRPYAPSSQSSIHAPSTATVLEGERLGAISPAPPSSSQSMNPFTDRFARSPQPGLTNRYSTSLLNPPGHSPPARAPSTSSSFASSSAASSSTSFRSRRLPPHMQAIRNAAATNPDFSSSLFPQTSPPDHVPYRERTSSPGNYSHRITAWHPPAPSIASAPPPGSAKGHISRKSSLSNRSAFASTIKARNLGFFRSRSRRGRERDRLFGPEFAGAANSPRPGTRRNKRGDGGDVGSMMETRSIFTTFTKGEGRCTVM